jgi:hypothetical protein
VFVEFRLSQQQGVRQRHLLRLLYLRREPPLVLLQQQRRLLRLHGV